MKIVMALLITLFSQGVFSASGKVEENKKPLCKYLNDGARRIKVMSEDKSKEIPSNATKSTSLSK